MIHRIVGTAGHIDHGKTALVRALTGVETDRLKEERRRGITIDLGFAPLELRPGLRVGLVDVPGHERFVRNMLAGAGGIDIVILVVAADESVKPQTREHFQICRLLGVSAGVIALSKIDRADDVMQELVREEIRDLVQDTFLAGAPVVPVSAVTGEGIEDLRQALVEVVEAAPLPARPAFARLPVDRVFPARGFGLVVTGTLLSGAVVTGDELELWPGGDLLRVRRVEVHGEETDSAVAGQRTALNLAGGARVCPRRGMVLAAPGRMQPASLLDVQLQVLASIRDGLAADAPVRLHQGTAEVAARVRLLEGGEAVAPGASAFAQLRLSRPLAVTVGDRFILRCPSPSRTVAGGYVLDPSARKHGAGAVTVLEGLRLLESGSLAQRLGVLLDDAGEGGASLQDLVRRTGKEAEELRAVLGGEEGAAAVLLATSGSEYMGATAAAQVCQRLEALLEAFHRDQPLAAGMSLEELRRRGAPWTGEALVNALLQRLESSGLVRLEGQRAAAGAHRVNLPDEDEQILSRTSARLRQAGLDPPEPVALLAEEGASPARAASLLRVLRERGELVRIAEGYFVHSQVLEELKRRLWEVRRESPFIDVAAFKALTSTSRRTAIPLLEYLDAEKITTRRGNQRYIQDPGTAS